MSRNWDGWADDFQTQQERWDAQYKRHADLRAAADAAALARGWRETRGTWARTAGYITERLLSRVRLRLPADRG